MATLVKKHRGGYYVTNHNRVLRQVASISDGKLLMYSFMLVDVDGEVRRGAFALECGDTFDWVQHG